MTIEELSEQMRLANERNDKHAYYKAKDAIYAIRKASGEWPSKTCEFCKHGCCHRYHHFTYDCCIHCGNDERRGR